MARLGTKAAKEVLAGVMRDFRVDLADLQNKSRTENVCKAKQAFLDRCGERRIQTAAMAEVLGLTTCTISYRRSPRMQETGRLNAARRRARAKAAVSAAVFAGAW